MDKLGSCSPWNFTPESNQLTQTGRVESRHLLTDVMLTTINSGELSETAYSLEDVTMMSQEEVEERRNIRRTCKEIIAKEEFKTWIQLERKSLSEAVLVDLIFLECHGHLVKELSFDFEYLDIKNIAFLPHLAKYLPNVKVLRIQGYYAEEEYVSLSQEQETKLFKKKERDLFESCAAHFPNLKKIHTSGFAFSDPDSIERIFADFTSIIIFNESEVILRKMPVA